MPPFFVASGRILLTTPGAVPRTRERARKRERSRPTDTTAIRIFPFHERTDTNYNRLKALIISMHFQIDMILSRPEPIFSYRSCVEPP